MGRDLDTPGKSILNWAGLGLLILLIIGTILLSRESGPFDQPGESASNGSSIPIVSELLADSPLVTPDFAVAAPVSSPTAVPGANLLATARAPISPLASTTSDSHAPSTPISGADIQIAVLHSNDTWGYLLPCG
jgi:hypothetical protein